MSLLLSFLFFIFFQITERLIIGLAYIPGNVIRIKAKAVGKLAVSEGEDEISVTREEAKPPNVDSLLGQTPAIYSSSSCNDEASHQSIRKSQCDLDHTVTEYVIHEGGKYNYQKVQIYMY